MNLFIIMGYPYKKKMFNFQLIWNAKFILFYISQIHSFSIKVQELFFLRYTKFHLNYLFLQRCILKTFILLTGLIHKLRNPAIFTNSFLITINVRINFFTNLL